MNSPASGLCFWFTGLPCSGKTTLAKCLKERLEGMGRAVTLLDGDEIRKFISADLGFSPEDRHTNVMRVAERAHAIVERGEVAICAMVSPSEKSRQEARELIGSPNFMEIFVNTSPVVCEQRDVKGMYKKARAGEIEHFTGVDDPYERPSKPEAEVDTLMISPMSIIDELLRLLGRRKSPV